MTKLTIGISLTESELATIREAAFGLDQSNSSFMAACIAQALSSKANWATALASIEIVAKKGVTRRERTKRASALVDPLTHAKLMVACREAGVTVHDLVQGVCLALAEIALKRRPVDATRRVMPVSGRVEREIRQLGKIRVGAAELSPTGYLEAGTRLRSTIERLGERSRPLHLASPLDRCPASLRDTVLMVAGWVGVDPQLVWGAIDEKARQPDAIEPGGSKIGPDVDHDDPLQFD